MKASHTQDLAQELWRIEEKNSIFYKAFQVIGPAGDYLEFGTYNGDSLMKAYWACRRILEELTGETWNHSFADTGGKETRLSWLLDQWSKMRFIAFDSFEGMPEISGRDRIIPVFDKGSYKCDIEDFYANIQRGEVPRERVIAVKGFFEETLTTATAERLRLEKIGIVHIDCDLYESACRALDFVSPYLRDGTVVVFDDWYQFMGNPTLGEQRAFAEWRERNPEWLVTEFHKEGAFRNSFFLNKRY